MPNNALSFRFWVMPVVFAGIFLLAPVHCAEAQSMARKEINRELLQTMSTIRNGKTLMSRYRAAVHLAKLTDGIDPHLVDDTTITEMVSLLDTKEDAVRLWVAGSLGLLGSRAKEAVPRLLKLLPEVDCLPGEVTSAPAIRLALERMGEKPPPPRDCRAKTGQ